jgi:hypothetical protein
VIEIVVAGREALGAPTDRFAQVFLRGAVAATGDRAWLARPIPLVVAARRDPAPAYYRLCPRRCREPVPVQGFRMKTSQHLRMRRIAADPTLGKIEALCVRGRTVHGFTSKGVLLAWDRDGAEQGRIEIGEPTFADAAWTRDGARAFATGPRGKLYAVDLAAGTRTAVEVPGLDQWTSDRIDVVALAPDGRRFATGSMFGYVDVWDAVTLERLTRGQAGEHTWALGYAPDGATIWAGDMSGEVRIFDVDAAVIGTLAAHDTCVTGFAWIGDVAVTIAKADVAWWDVSRGGAHAKELARSERAEYEMRDGGEVAPTGHIVAMFGRALELFVPTSPIAIDTVQLDDKITALAVADDGTIAAGAGGELWLGELVGLPALPRPSPTRPVELAALGELPASWRAIVTGEFDDRRCALAAHLRTWCAPDRSSPRIDELAAALVAAEADREHGLVLTFARAGGGRLRCALAAPYDDRLGHDGLPASFAAFVSIHNGVLLGDGPPEGLAFEGYDPRAAHGVTSSLPVRELGGDAARYRGFCDVEQDWLMWDLDDRDRTGLPFVRIASHAAPLAASRRYHGQEEGALGVGEVMIAELARAVLDGDD